MDQFEAQEFINEGFMEKGVDTRKDLQAKQMKMYPYNCLLMLIGEVLHNGKVHPLVGTGFLINEYYALTAAHNIWDKEQNQYIKKVRVFPAIHGKFDYNKTQPQENAVAKPIFHEQYLKKLQEIKMKEKKNEKSDINLNLYDYALIRLKNPIKRVNYLSILPVLLNYQKLSFEITGYSGFISSKEANQSIKVAIPKRGIGRVRDISSERGIKTIIQHKIDTSYGQSGSPIMIEIGGVFHVIGIHYCHSKVKTLNFAIHLNENKIDHINHWMKVLEKRAFPPLAILEYGKLQQIHLKELHNELYYFKEEEKKVYQFINGSPATHFRFNWDIARSTEKELRVEGKQVTKTTDFQKNNYASISSMEALPKLEHCSIKVRVITLAPEGRIWVGIVNESTKKQIENKELGIQDINGLIGITLTKDRLRVSGYSWKETLPKEYVAKVEGGSQVLLTSYREGDNLALMAVKEQKVVFKDFFTKEHEFGKDHYLCVVLKEKGDSVTILK